LTKENIKINANKVLIFGGTGFVGKHMSAQCPDGFRVIPVGRTSDICDKASVRRLIEAIRPTVVVNFASVTTIKESIADPRLCYSISFYGMLNLLEVLDECNFTGILLYSSSSEVYGHPDHINFPIKECYSPVNPMNPYAVGKMATEYLCKYWYNKSSTKIIIARPFTHIGPGQSENFAISNFAKQISEVKRGIRKPELKVGNINTSRDLTDVRDIVRAYWLLIKYGRIGEIYNICSGIERNIGDVLMDLIKLSKLPINIKVDPLLIRENEMKRIIGSYEKINIDTGWKPVISIEETLTDLLSYWDK
jgi:GDP-4-dehydro-6-deoxy-D-mannose reductase